MKCTFAITIAFLFLALNVFGQTPVYRFDLSHPEPDTAPKPGPVRRSGIRPYATVIKGFHTQRGLFTVHTLADSVYFEIPDSILHRDIMVINRLKKGPGMLNAYPGEELDEETIKFEKGPDSTILIRYDLVISDADSSSAIHKAVVNANLDPIVVSFPIKAYGKDSASYVIDVSHFLKDDNFINSIKAGSKLGDSISKLKDYYIESIRTYPLNVEISIRKNGVAKHGPYGDGQGPATLVTNTSFIALPWVPMQRRYFDPRVGYLADEYWAYGDHQQKSEIRQFILRWRLEPKPEDKEKWERGELVEPAKPIVFYIDPATPKQWRKYLILGIEDWQKAFEQAGFKNAILGKEWPENDTTMHMEDARYSFLNYFPSDVENAYGPQVHDPRSGEIIQSHIGWYHNIMKLLHDWYLIQAGATDPQADMPVFNEELMGNLIRFVCSHEVGHTLGLRHNFGSSSTVPVDSLRSRTWLQLHGHTPSIMDYARFDYVAQPEDHIPQVNLWPHIGEYDRWAIEWGYRRSGGANADEDKIVANRLITDSVSRNPRLWFGDGESRKVDPCCQMEDLGNDAMKASAYGIKNLQRILPHLPAWTHETSGLYDNLQDAYKELKTQYFRYMNHVLKNLTGYRYTTRSEDAPGDVFAPVSRQLQREALDFFDVQLFTTPYWLLDSTVADRAADPGKVNFVQDVQIRVLNSLLDVKQLNLVLGNSLRFSQKTISLPEYVSQIHQDIWRELHGTGQIKIDAYRRNLQKSYLGNLGDIMKSTDADQTETDVYSFVRADLEQLSKEVGAAIPRSGDTLTRYHLEDVAARIKKLLTIRPD
jgi:hypothetical protein